MSFPFFTKLIDHGYTAFDVWAILYFRRVAGATEHDFHRLESDKK
jgi:hypothetical protein